MTTSEKEINDQAQEAEHGVPEDDYAFLRGTVVRVTYHNQDSGFAVIKAEPESGTRDPHNTSSALATIVGPVPPTIAAGTCFIARGEWQTHPKFGRQFRARSVVEADPTGIEAIERYLGSGAVKGFGPVLAERVMKLFGDKALEIIDLHPERLLEVPGIGSRKLEEIREAWQKKRSVREVMLFFQNHGISINLAQRIFNAYGERAIEVVTRNPYLLARDVWGIGFQTADAIARALGTDPKARERIIAGISYVLQQASDDGHCFLPRDVLLTKTASLLVLDEEELLSSALADAELRADVVREDTRIYLPSLWQAETQLAHCIAERLRSCARPLPAIAAKFVHSVCEQAQLGHAPSGAAPSPGNRDAVIRLSEQQKQAVHLAADSSMIIVTGGPGCGKTTVVRVMAQMLRKAGLQVKLCAPTGRAAQRLAELCGMPASTIHRLLKYDPVARGFQHDPNNLLPLQALIVDECSMIDVPLAAALLRAVPPSARIILVGDADQLPSVGPGLFFNDLLDVQQIPRVRLTVLFRRAEESLITSIAHQINSAVVPEIPEPDGATKSDAYFLPASDAENAAALVERLVVEQIPKKFGFRGTDITVLTPVNQGVLGVQALNRRLQERLVPPLPGLPRVTVGELELRHGDRVIQRVNNYNIHPAGVFNGDQGEVVGVDAESRSIFIRLWDGREIQYDADALDELDLAYALTIHRSQGSEVPVVVLALHDSHNIMLERQLIYTGVTRAKRLLVVVGTRRALAIAAKRSRSKRRYSELAAKISGG